MKFSNLMFSLSIIILIVAVSPAQSQCPPAYIYTGVNSSFAGALGISVSGAGDVDVDGYVGNTMDLTYLVDVIFRGGPVLPKC